MGVFFFLFFFEKKKVFLLSFFFLQIDENQAIKNDRAETP